MAYVLTEETFDTFSKLPRPVHIFLVEPPLFPRSQPRAKGRNHGGDPPVLCHISHQVPQPWERFHGFHRNFTLDSIDAGLAHQPWLSVYLGGARAAPSRFAIPPS